MKQFHIACTMSDRQRQLLVAESPRVLAAQSYIYMNTQTHNNIYYYNIMHTVASRRYYYNLFEFSSLLRLKILYSFSFHVPLKKSNDSFVSLTVFGSCGTTPSASPNSALSNFERLPATFNDSCNNIYIHTQCKLI